MMNFKNNTVLIGKSALFCFFFTVSFIIYRSVHARFSHPFKYFTEGYSPVRHSLKLQCLASRSKTTQRLLLLLKYITNTIVHLMPQ